MTDSEKITDSELIARIQKGEKALYEMIVRRYNPYLYKTGRTWHFSHEDTQDLMQETFIDAYKNLNKFEGRSGFKTWLIRIMLNNCYRKSRKAEYKNELITTINDNAIPMFNNNSHDTGHMVQNRELGQIIETALSRIPFNYRLAFSLREISGLNVAETAEILNITEANVKVRVNRAKTMLREEIEKTYAPQTLYAFNLIYCDAMVDRVMNAIKDL